MMKSCGAFSLSREGTVIDFGGVGSLREVCGSTGSQIPAFVGD